MSHCGIDRALLDPRLLGGGLGNSSTWGTWLSILKAAYGLPLDDRQRQIFAGVAGERNPPSRRVRELWIVAGRRSAKSRMSAAIAIHSALFVRHKLAAGETGMALVLASTVDQAKAVFNYTLGFLNASPAMAKEIASTTRYEITLRNGIVIAVHPNNFRSIRGRTLICAGLDEVSFWRDESSATPDLETYRAIVPSLSTTDGLLVGISTPYRKTGLMFTKYRDHFGVDGDDVLVVKGGSKTFNPTLSEPMIAAHRLSDPVAAASEWDAEFRSDIGSFLDDVSIDQAIDYGRPLELPPQQNTRYFAFTDMSGGGADASTVGIVHVEGERYIADAVRGRKGNPQEAVIEFVKLVKQYRCSTITGDNYAKEWVAGAYRGAGLEYRRAPLPRSDLYLEGLPLFTRGLVSIPDHQQLIREMRLLERRVARSGKDAVNHGIGGHDDHANALFGALYVAAKATAHRMPGFVAPYAWSKTSGVISDPCAAAGAQRSTTQKFYDAGGYGGGGWPGSDRSSYDW